jgi:hypothetical protein
MTTGNAITRKGICTNSIGTPALARIGCIIVTNVSGQPRAKRVVL